MNLILAIMHRCCLIHFSDGNDSGWSAKESLGLQKQTDGHQWTEPGDQQSHFHPQG